MSEQKVAVLSCAAEAVRRSRRCCPIHIWTSENQNGDVSEGLSVYSPGRRRKKKASPIMSAVPWIKGSFEACAMAKMRRMTIIGTGLTRFGGGSCLEYARSIRRKVKSV